MQLCISTGLKYLKALTLKCVNVNEEALDGFFSSCPNLKYISIHGSGDLRNVKVSGFTLALKYLEIVFCLGIESIEISNVNLISFSYLGPGIDIIVNNVPMLDEVSIGVGYSGLANNVFGQLSCCLYQLQLLTLDIYRPYVSTQGLACLFLFRLKMSLNASWFLIFQEDMTVYAFPLLPNLKQLILKVGAWEDDCLLEFSSFIKRCPRLDRFVLQVCV